MESMRIDKFLAKCGYGSRKQVRDLLKNGVVKVDKAVIKDAAFHINPVAQLIEIDGLQVSYREFVYIMLNKPEGVVSATTDNKFQTVTDLVKQDYLNYSLFPAGRLDRDSEGLILLTNDGKLAHRITAPGRNVPKLYSVIIDSAVGQEEINAFSRGILLDDGYVTLPAKLEVSDDNPTHTLVTIYEGKFHQIKRMFISAGRRVVKLKRLKIGDLELDPLLEPGEYRELTEVEEDLLKKL